MHSHPSLRWKMASDRGTPTTLPASFNKGAPIEGTAVSVKEIQVGTDPRLSDKRSRGRVMSQSKRMS